ncbi:hypothetical protein [Aquipuribacter hungaricus]|uniref:Uncharacterized protein n=1 Tax=Aquipuribacter hungaricus TaxID=545624 RepID=A0ABV7WAX3_9MICO
MGVLLIAVVAYIGFMLLMLPFVLFYDATGPAGVAVVGALLVGLAVCKWLVYRNQPRQRARARAMKAEHDPARREALRAGWRAEEAAEFDRQVAKREAAALLAAEDAAKEAQAAARKIAQEDAARRARTQRELVKLRAARVVSATGTPDGNARP